MATEVDYNQMIIENENKNDDDLPQLIDTTNDGTGSVDSVNTSTVPNQNQPKKAPKAKKMAKKIQKDPKMIQLAQQQRMMAMNPPVSEEVPLRERLQRKLEATRMSRTSRLSQQHVQDVKKSKINAKIEKLQKQEVPVENISIDLNQGSNINIGNVNNVDVPVPTFEEYTKFLADTTNDSLSPSELDHAKQMVQSYNNHHNISSEMKTMNFDDSNDSDDE